MYWTQKQNAAYVLTQKTKDAAYVLTKKNDAAYAVSLLVCINL